MARFKSKPNANAEVGNDFASGAKLTKNGKRQKLTKATITAKRLLFREAAWGQIKVQLRVFLAKGGHGTAFRMSEALGVSPSQIHRWTCPVCEHDTEPSFSVGMAILLYMKMKCRITQIELTNRNCKITTYLYESKLIKEARHPDVQPSTCNKARRVHPSSRIKGRTSRDARPGGVKTSHPRASSQSLPRSR